MLVKGGGGSVCVVPRTVHVRRSATSTTPSGVYIPPKDSPRGTPREPLGQGPSGKPDRSKVWWWDCIVVHTHHVRLNRPEPCVTPVGEGQRADPEGFPRLV